MVIHQNPTFHQSSGQSTSQPHSNIIQKRALASVPEDSWADMFTDEVGTKLSNEDNKNKNNNSNGGSPARVPRDPPGSTLPYNRSDSEEDEDEEEEGDNHNDNSTTAAPNSTATPDKPLAPNLTAAKEALGGSGSARTFGMESIPEEGESVLSTASYSFVQPPPAHLLHSTDDDQSSSEGEAEIEQTVLQLPDDYDPPREQSLASLSQESASHVSSQEGSRISQGSGAAAPVPAPAVTFDAAAPTIINRNNQNNNYTANDIEKGIPPPALELDDFDTTLDRDERRQKERQNRAMTRAVIYFGVGCLIMAGAIVAVIFLVGTGNQTGEEEPIPESMTPESANSANVAASPTAASGSTPTMAPTPSLNSTIFNLLPEFSQETIQADPINSPQAKAYQWLVEDVTMGELGTLSDSRRLQRYSLATLYYATDGPTSWTRRDNWLNHSTHECEWYHTDFALDTTNANEIGGVCSDPASPNQTDSLQYLLLTQNQLQGTLPPELSLLTTLRILSLGQNEIGGSIPTQIAALTNLASLDVATNRLTGSLPTQLGTLSSLEVLSLEDNPNLGGTVPTELALLQTNGSLTRFSIQDTNVTGQVPDELCSIETLEFDCSSQLCGCSWCPCNDAPGQTEVIPVDELMSTNVPMPTNTDANEEEQLDNTDAPTRTPSSPPSDPATEMANTNVPMPTDSGANKPLETVAPTPSISDGNASQTEPPTIMFTNAPTNAAIDTALLETTNAPTNVEIDALFGTTTELTSAPTDSITDETTSATISTLAPTTDSSESKDDIIIDSNALESLTAVASNANSTGYDSNHQASLPVDIILDNAVDDNLTIAEGEDITTDLGSLLMGTTTNNNYMYVEMP